MVCLLDKMHLLVNRHIFFQETWGVYKYWDSSFIVTLHNFILFVCVGDSQSNDITIHNKDLTNLTSLSQLTTTPNQLTTTIHHTIDQNPSSRDPPKPTTYNVSATRPKLPPLHNQRERERKKEKWEEWDTKKMKKEREWLIKKEAIERVNQREEKLDKLKEREWGVRERREKKESQRFEMERGEREDGFREERKWIKQ